MAPAVHPDALDSFEIWDSNSVVGILVQTVAKRD